MLNKELSPVEIKKTVINSRPFQAAFTGGEPLIKLGISKVIRDILSYPGPPFIISINTNGFATYMISREVGRFVDIARASGKKIAVSVSIDGPEEVHDYVRGVRGSFRRAIRTLKNLVKLSKAKGNLNVFIEYTVMEYNVGRFSDMLNEVESILGARIPGDMIVINVIQSSDYYNVRIDPNYQKLINEIVNIRRELRKRYGFGNRFSPHGIVQSAFLNRLEKWLKGNYQHNCFAAEKSALVDPYGDVYPCLPKYGKYKLGNVRDYGYNVRRVLSNEISNYFRREIRPFCNCWTPCESYTTLLARPWNLMK